MKFSLCAALLAVCLFAAPVRAEESAAEKLGWRLALQCWTFNSKTFFETVDIAAKLGIKYVEMIPGQKMKPGSNVGTGPGMSEEAIAECKKKLADSGVKAVNWGVGGANKASFEWAKKMGIETIVCEAGENALPDIDKLCEEYGISIALHNHPKPNSHYWDPDTVVKACEGLSKRAGACADTGHWKRSDLVPVECLKKLEGRIISLHFKDLNAAKQDVPFGTGTCDVKGMLAELKRQKLKAVFSLEYENWTPELQDNLAKCVKFFEDTAKELAEQK